MPKRKDPPMYFIGIANSYGLESGLKAIKSIALTVEAVICQTCSRVTLKQTFVNSKRKQLDNAVYAFPRYKWAAIVAFTCTLEDQVIVGKIEDRHTARQVYETTKARGDLAVDLLPLVPSDLWVTQICTIPAGAKVEVEITLVAELEHDIPSDGLRFVLPENILRDFNGFELKIAVTMVSPITSLKSPSHPIIVGMGTHSPSTSPSEEERDECKGYVTLSQTASDRDSDFVLIVSTADMGQPQAIVETHSALGNNQRAVLLSLVPKFQMSRISPEIIFIADINGIMGRQLPQLRHALTVFLKTLTVGVKFNICTFGSSHSFLWPESMPYDKENLHTALKYVQTFEEDLRGIQILPPVEDALQKRYKDLQTEIIVLNHMPINYTESLLDFVRKECDGGDVRVFSLGIGSEANVEGLARAGRGYAHIVGIGDELDVEVLWMLNAALQEHVKEYKISFSAADSTSPAATTSKSEHGGDEALEIVQHEESSSAPAPKPEEAKLQPEVISLSTASASADAKSKHLSSTERFAHLPALEVPTRIQTPHRIPPLYPLCRTNVYVLLSGSEPTPRVITLWCHTTSGSRVKLNVPVRDVGLGTTVHHLAAKELLEELEVGGSYLHSGEFGVDPQTEPETFVDVVAREGWRVGSTFGVAGKWTNFVVVQAEEPKFDRPEHRASKSYVTFDTGSPTLLSCEPESLVSLVGMRRSERRSTVVSGVLGNRSAPPMWDLCSASQCSRLPRSLSVEEFGSVNELIRDPQDLELEGLDDSGPSECDGETVTQFAKSFEEMIAKLDEEHSNEPDPEEWVSGVVDHLTTWILQQGQGLETATLKALDRDVLQALVCSAMLALRFEKEGRVFHGAWGRIQAKINGWAVQTAGEAAWNALKNVWYQEYMQFWLEHGEEEDVYRERRGSGYYY